MAARPIPGIRQSVDIDYGANRRRRAVVAFIAGSVLFLAAAAAMISGGASARGGSGLFTTIFVPLPAESATSRGLQFVATEVALGKSSGRRHAHSASGHRKAYSVAVNISSRRPVCVRLCDGFFFPASEPAGAGDAAGEQAACDSQCPDAPVALFYQPSGSDQIEDAYSVAGQPYTALPIALRYRSTQDNTCACHRSLAAAFSPLLDATLRKGDVLMTPKGFVVFHGVEQAKHKPADFAALASAGLPADQRTTLRALERVSMAPQRGVPRSWVAATAPAPAPSAIKTATRDLSDKIRFVERSE